MATTSACRRHKRGDLAGWYPVDNDGGTQWAIAEVHNCKLCGAHMDQRIVPGTVRRTQRDAMVAYGLAPAEVEAFFPPRAPAPAPAPPVAAPSAPPVAMALTCWPFPGSTRYYRIPEEKT